jgi:alpha 1,2-mannosyltransferase
MAFVGSLQIKGLAIVQSSFDEILYLDSVSSRPRLLTFAESCRWLDDRHLPLYPSPQDNIPLRDPTHLFDSKRYNTPGSGRAAFWPDLSKDHVDNAIWRFVGDPCTLEHWTFESGQIVIDKVGRSTVGRKLLG